MWWKDLGDPVSGVANCHSPGIYSLLFDEDTRVFIVDDWTPLAANLFGDAVGFHDHHRNIGIKVLVGDILNVVPVMSRGERSHMGYVPWTWDSSLRGGKGKFKKSGETDKFVSDKFSFRHLTKDCPPLFMKRSEFHTVHQMSKRAAWVVREDGPSTAAPTTNWSRLSLSKWPNGVSMYEPLDERATAKLWNAFKWTTK